MSSWMSRELRQDTDPSAEVDAVQPGGGPEPPPPPMLSRDGRFWWDGRTWQPVHRGDQRMEPAPLPSPATASLSGAPASAVPSRSSRFIADQYLRTKPPAPTGAGARLLYTVSGGRVNLGPSQQELTRMRLMGEVRTPVLDPPARIAVASAKGGVGKSTIALLVASMLGTHRTDRVIAVECNPHHGTFQSRVRTYHERSIKDLIDFLDSSQIERDEDLTLPMLHRFTTQSSELRLEVMAAPTDPRIRKALSENDYRRVFNVLYRYFDIIVFDLGTGLLDDNTKYILEQVCDQVVVMAPAELDGAELGAFTLEFVAGGRGPEWVQQRAVVAINRVATDTQIDVGNLERYFEQWAQACLRIGQDPHLREGGVFNWELVGAVTNQQILGLTAQVAKGFGLGAAPDGEKASMYR